AHRSPGSSCGAVKQIGSARAKRKSPRPPAGADGRATHICLVVPAKAGTHGAAHRGLWNMAPRLRGDDPLVLWAPLPARSSHLSSSPPAPSFSLSRFVSSSPSSLRHLSSPRAAVASRAAALCFCRPRTRDGGAPGRVTVEPPRLRGATNYLPSDGRAPLG